MSLVLLNTALCVYVCMCVLTNLCKPHRMSHYAANKLRMSNYAANKLRMSNYAANKQVSD